MLWFEDLGILGFSPHDFLIASTKRSELDLLAVFALASFNFGYFSPPLSLIIILAFFFCCADVASVPAFPFSKEGVRRKSRKKQLNRKEAL